MDTPLDDPIAEKERLRKLAENADAKIIDEMFGGKADDSSGVAAHLPVAYISDTEKGLNMIKLNDITDYQQLAYKLGKKMNECGNATNTLEFLQQAIRQCGGMLTSDDFQKLSSTCNVMKEERKKDERVTTKKGKKKSKNMATIKVSGDSWQNQMEDEDHYDDYGDDFM